MSKEEFLQIGTVLEVMKLDAEVSACDENGNERWRGPVRRFPWLMLDADVLQVDAVGQDKFCIVTNTKESEWK